MRPTARTPTDSISSSTCTDHLVRSGRRTQKAERRCAQAKGRRKIKGCPLLAPRISEVIILSLRIGAHVFRRHQAGVVAKHSELATEMMRADAGLHTDQARRQVGKPRFHLAT